MSSGVPIRRTPEPLTMARMVSPDDPASSCRPIAVAMTPGLMELIRRPDDPIATRGRHPKLVGTLGEWICGFTTGDCRRSACGQAQQLDAGTVASWRSTSGGIGGWK